MKRVRPYHPGLILTFAALLAALPTLGIAESTAPSARREKMRANGDRLADGLNLTDDQRAKMKSLFEQERAELEALKNDASLSEEDRRSRAGAVHRKYRDLRDALLTPEQRAKADAMRDHAVKRRGESGDKSAGQ
jgi:Spy/CpxP family protein refolding chaperone